MTSALLIHKIAIVFIISSAILKYCNNLNCRQNDFERNIRSKALSDERTNYYKARAKMKILQKRKFDIRKIIYFIIGLVISKIIYKII